MPIHDARTAANAPTMITAEQVADHGFDSRLTGVRWFDGTVECRARLLHPAGSLAARPGYVGAVLTGDDVACDNCSDACGM